MALELVTMGAVPEAAGSVSRRGSGKTKREAKQREMLSRLTGLQEYLRGQALRHNGTERRALLAWHEAVDWARGQTERTTT